MFNEFKLSVHKKKFLVIVFVVFVLLPFIRKDEFKQRVSDSYDELSQVSFEREHVPVSSSTSYKRSSFRKVITGNKVEMFSKVNQLSDEQDIPITILECEESIEGLFVQSAEINSNDADVITIMEDMEIVWAEGMSVRVPAGATVENGMTIRMGEQGGQAIYPNGYTEIYPAGYAIEFLNLSGDKVSVMDTVSNSLLESSGCSISNVFIVGLILLLLRNQDKLHCTDNIK